jgi:hypothetical protein
MKSSVRSKLVLLILTVAALMSACGGGGGSSSAADTTPAPVTPVADPVGDAAKTAKLSATYRPDAQQVTLTWTDPYANETGYRIDKLAGGAWIALDTLPATAGSGTVVTSVVPITADMTLRVVALVGSNSAVLSTAALTDQVSIATQASQPAIVLSATEPLQGSVALSMTGVPATAGVRYFIDFAALGDSNTQSPFQQPWNTVLVNDGSHLIQALVQLTPDNLIELRRQVTVSNVVAPPPPPTGLQPSIALAATNFGTQVKIGAGSAVGIASVKLFIDGQLFGTLIALNGCTSLMYCVPSYYRFDLVSANFSNGVHQLLAVAQDNNGLTGQAGTTWSVNNPPQITVSRPANGEIVTSGLLRVSGLVTDDTQVADVRILLGAVEIRKLPSGSFDFSYDISGVANGSYTLTVNATDLQGLVSTTAVPFTVRTGYPTSPELVTGLAAGATLYGLEGDAALLSWNYSSAGQQPPQELQNRVIRGSLASGLSTLYLDRSTLTYQSGQLQLSGTRVISGGVGDDSGGSYNIYLWGADGLRRNLSQEAAETDTSQLGPTLTGDWAAWNSVQSKHLTLFNVVTRQKLTVAPPTAGYGLGSAALTPKGTGVVMCTWTQDSGTTADNSTYGVYLYDSTTQSLQRVSPTGVRDIYPQCDGSRLAWRRVPAGSVGPPFDLLVTPMSNLTASPRVINNVAQFFLKDGLLAWQEQTVNANVLRVDTGTATVTLTNLLGAQLMAVGGGAVAYQVGGQLMLWTPASGSRFVLDRAPDTVFITRGWIYFLAGAGSALERVAFAD